MKKILLFGTFLIVSITVVAQRGNYQNMSAEERAQLQTDRMAEHVLRRGDLGGGRGHGRDGGEEGGEGDGSHGPLLGRRSPESGAGFSAAETATKSPNCLSGSLKVTAKSVTVGTSVSPGAGSVSSTRNANPKAVIKTRSLALRSCPGSSTDTTWGPGARL